MSLKRHEIEEIEEKAGLDKKSQDAMYRFLSSEIHANPLSVEMTYGNVSVNGFSQQTLIILLAYATQYLNLYIQGITKLFPEIC